MVCSPEYLKDKLKLIKDTLKSNGYKAWQINKGISKKQNPVSTTISSTTMNLHKNSCIEYISASYIDGISEKNEPSFKKIKKFFLTSKPTTTSKSKLNNLKDKVSQINQINVIY